jgi:hypothetical protein
LIDGAAALGGAGAGNGGTRFVAPAADFRPTGLHMGYCSSAKPVLFDCRFSAETDLPRSNTRKGDGVRGDFRKWLDVLVWPIYCATI